MEDDIDETGMLDYAVFHTYNTQNIYEALACSKGKIVTVASGVLDQLALYLSEAKGCKSNQSDTSFKLQLAENQIWFSWFTKGTLARFLHIVNTPEALKVAVAIEGEITQLEETKKFHISLYAKDRDQSGDATTDALLELSTHAPSPLLSSDKGLSLPIALYKDISCLKDIGMNQQLKVEMASSDATKNELLRALDMRLVTLEEELASSFNRAAGATCSIQQISELSAFTEHFGVLDLRNFLLKLLARRLKNQPTDSLAVKQVSLQDMGNNNDNSLQEIPHQSPQTVVKPVKNVVSPAKIAQVERQSSSESEESSESSDEDQSHAKRSHSLVRSATRRRSASPMRRVQIGRSGSRRSSALTIKSLNYFPPRESSFIRDADGSNNGDEQELNQPPEKPENAVRRMSVQDAISLFESKQKDQNSDVQKRRVVGEVPVSTTAKFVLRRWSAGMGDSFTHISHENTSNATPQDTPEETKPAQEKVDSSITDDSPQVALSSEVDNPVLPPSESPAEPIVPKVEEVDDQAADSTEWSRLKEAELDQMLMKMTESSKLGNHQGTSGGKGLQQDAGIEQRGGFYSQYREKREEKLRGEHSGKQAVKEAQFKVMKENLEQSKAKMASKTVSSITGKGDSANHSQRPRRNSSPPALPKKELPKPSGMRKASSSKTSPLPATRKSWSGGALPRTSGTATPKTPSGMVSSTINTTNSRTPLLTSSPIQPSPKAERSQQIKKKGTSSDVKPSLKVQEEKKQMSATKVTNKIVKPKNPSTTVDEATVLSAKPSFYNKVTKKSSIVPLESKPFLKKGTGLGPTRSSPIAARSKVSLPDDSSKNRASPIQPVENESIPATAEPNPNVLEANVAQLAGNEGNVEVTLDNDLNHDNTEEWDQGRDESDYGFNNAVELPIQEIKVVVEDIGISSPAWVDVNHQGGSFSRDIDLPSHTMSPELPSPVALSSSRVRHSLSQMLQDDNNEPEIIEWGNAENPPVFVYQKDAPKGFRRLLNFARKSKGEVNMSGLASPSVFSEGEDDTEESKAASKRSSDALTRKAALQAKGYEPPKSMVSGSSDGGNSSKRSMDHRGMNEILPAQSSSAMATIVDRLREGQNSASATSNKATRSFFSLSTFRSNKPSDAKLR